MEFPLSRHIKNGLSVLMVFTSGFVMISLIWGIDKGFDMTDEAYYLLGMLPSQERLSTFAALQFTLASRAFGWLDGVITFRILSLLITILAAIVFSWGFFQLIRRYYSATVLSPLAVSAWFLSGSFFVVPALTLTFSYNVSINSIMLFTGGLAFSALSVTDQPGRKWRRWCSWAAVGALLTFALMVKPTAALALGLILVIGGFLLYLPKWKDFIWDIVLPGLVGVMLALTIVFGLDVINPILATLPDRFVHPGHNPSELIGLLWTDLGFIFDHFAQEWVAFLAAFACGIWALRNSRTTSNGSPWLAICACMGLIAIVCLTSPISMDALFRMVRRMPVLHVWLAVLVILFLMVIPGIAKRGNFRFRPRLAMARSEIQKIILGLILLLLPPACAFGSNNTMTFQVWIYVGPWMGLLYVLFLETQSNRIAWPTGWVALTFIVIWAWASWTNSYFFYPYRLLQDRLSQTESLSVRSSHFIGLKVDTETKKFLEAYDSILANSKTKPGSGVIAIYNNPGLVYLSDGYSPGDIWFQQGNVWHDPIADFINSSSLPRKGGLILINQLLPEVITDALSKPEIDFPRAYRQLGRLLDPINGMEVTIYERRW